MSTTRRLRDIPFALGSFFLFACTAPRSVMLSPEATPKGQFRAGAEVGFNLATQTTGALYDGLESSAKRLWNQSRGDTVAITADSLNVFAKALMAYSLDPLTVPAGVQFRYGLWHRLDVGYRFVGGVHAFDLRYQWMGPEDAKLPGWRSSLDVQYSSQDYQLPSALGLDKLQDLLQYEFTRKDILVPLIFGRPFGPEGRFGSVGMGMAYDLSFVEWDSQLLKIVEKVPGGGTRAFDPIRGKKTISAYGGFANLRLGYRYVFLVGSLSAYWQDYGSYRLFGGKTASLSGWTLAPAAGLEFRF
jgi:hypothetical protein